MTMAAIVQTASLAELPGRAAPPAPASAWRRYAAIMFALQMAHLLFESVRTDHALSLGLLDWLAYKGDEVIRQSLNVAAAGIALQFIDRLRAPRPHRTPAALAAMTAAGLASAAAAAFMFSYEPVAVRVGASASTAVWFWYTLWMNTLIGVLALVAIDSLRGRQQAVTRLTAVQEQGRIARQQLASAQLLAIQARVDPQLLFDMLGAVKRSYEQDVARAEELLDELSAFLRAALPRLRSACSTLEIEFALVQSYARLLRDAGTAHIDLRIALPDALASAAFPPGVLMPLLASAAATPRRVTLEASARGAGLCIQVSDTTTPAAVTLERLRGSLSALYGERGQLQVQPLGAGVQLALEVPLEPA
jgi:type II secretory pathway pseudopilin PulG